MQVICQTLTPHYLLPGHQQLFSPPEQLETFEYGQAQEIGVDWHHITIISPSSHLFITLHTAEGQRAHRARHTPESDWPPLVPPSTRVRGCCIVLFHGCITEKVWWVQARGPPQHFYISFHYFYWKFNQMTTKRHNISKERPQRDKNDHKGIQNDHEERENYLKETHYNYNKTENDCEKTQNN